MTVIDTPEGIAFAKSTKGTDTMTNDSVQTCTHQDPYGGYCGNVETAWLHGRNENENEHIECGSGCVYHDFKSSEGVAQYILDSRKLREAAVAVADLAPPLAEALHLRAQDIFEAGEREARFAVPKGRYVVVTDNSVWLVEVNEVTAYVIDRATFGSPYLPAQRDVAGEVVFGKVAVNDRLRLDNGIITGVINAVYPHTYGAI